MSIESEEEDNGKNYIIIDNSGNSEGEKKLKKPGKYKQRVLLYFYYIINGNQYK